MPQIHQLNAIVKKSQRVGRGGRRGKTSGRGSEGQRKRAGRHLKPGWKETLLRAPKRRGYGFSAQSEKPFAVRLSDIDAKFKDGEFVDLRTLIARGLVHAAKGKKRIAVKVLDGACTKALRFSGALFLSQKARERVQSAKGAVNATS